jgi:hypothetical protein
MTPTARARMPRRIRLVLSDFSMTVLLPLLCWRARAASSQHQIYHI